MLKDLLAGGLILSAVGVVVSLIAMSTVGVLIAAIISDIFRFVGITFGGNKAFSVFRVLFILTIVLYIVWTIIPG